MMLLDNAVNGGSPNGAFADFLGGEKRLENPLHHAACPCRSRCRSPSGKQTARARSGCLPDGERHRFRHATVSITSVPPLGMASRALTARLMTICSVMPESAAIRGRSGSHYARSVICSPSIRGSMPSRLCSSVFKSRSFVLHHLLPAEHEQMPDETSGAVETRRRSASRISCGWRIGWPRVAARCRHALE